ncbi:alpha/beta fold hydrolase [Nakamurella deserti]|uniref:alpha/beta fold hydrolase n=1 Tax=Nakamurella deserti TaxID=2164074 RepID=UPI000DBE29A4|nr:alpha/beta fold hydrolase [Nakamurella deserti]
MWRRRRGLLIGLAVALVAVLAIVVWPKGGTATAATDDVTFTAPGGEGEDPTVTLDATIYLPEVTPAPAVILAHGLGGTKASVADDAQDLAAAGYVVLAYTARGFGASTGHVHLDSLDYEAQDGKAAVDYLATRGDIVTQDGADNPRVGVMGGSYGGALALMLGGIDPRVDAVVPLITWHDLSDALFPNFADTEGAAAGGDSLGGVFKKYWASVLVTSISLSGGAGGAGGAGGLGGLLGGANGAGSASSEASSSAGTTGSEPAGSDPTTPPGGATSGNGDTSGNGAAGGAPSAAGALCGRLATDLCTAYLQVAETGRLTPELKALLDRSSPSQVVGEITAPTLLVQGERDTLFGLDQADANAKAIAANGTDVSVIWFAGGHDGGGIDNQTRAAIHTWFDHYLRDEGDAPALGFRYSIDGAISDTGSVRSRMLQADGYPGIDGAAATEVPVTLNGRTAPVVNPPGGTPAAVSSLPGLGGTASTALATLGLDIPGQSATFTSDPLTSQLLLTGSATTTLSVTAGPPLSSAADASSDATLFLKLYKVTASGVRTLAGSAVSPIRVTGLTPGRTVDVPVSLTGFALQVDAGSSVQLVVSSTDQGYALPAQASVHLVGLAGDGVLTVPVAGGSNISTSEVPLGLLIALVVLIVVAITALVLAGLVRRRTPATDPELARIPLRISGLRKEYPGGVVAVKDVSFDVRPGQVVGLLGPNGAGKTTSLRMVMGLINPSAGEITVFGQKVVPGAPVLSRIGSFVEGSGFLPHLTGIDNLNLYWAATGRPAELAHLDEALAIAGLGTAVDRRVRTYSQGMRQRLAIAQAMLGLPDLLILDEPTNGLDPPQIHAMREVLRRYAATGRTVLVSSHLLAEVEQTCTDVVVVNKGEVIASGTVAELVALSGEMSFTVDDPERARTVLQRIPGVDGAEIEDQQVHVDLAGVAPAAAIAALVDAGVAVSSAAPRNRLEDVFLDLVGATGRGSSA